MSSPKLSAVEMVQSLKKGEITSEELVKSYIEQIKKKEKEVEAWEFFDQELVLNQAKKLDELHQSGKHGDLHGIPVGIKDIFDTENMPTTDGTEIHKELKIFLIQRICRLQMVLKFTKKIQVGMIVLLYRN